MSKLSSLLAGLADRTLETVVPHRVAAASPVCNGCYSSCRRFCCALGGANPWIVEICPRPEGGGCTRKVIAKC